MPRNVEIKARITSVGALRPIAANVPWERHKVTSALYSIMSEEQREAFERDLELDFAFTLSANARFRVNFYQQRNAIGGAFRLIPTEIKQLSELGIPDAVSAFASLPRGLVLVTGGILFGVRAAVVSPVATNSIAPHAVPVRAGDAFDQKGGAS